jgi:hypothetical protein
MCRSFRRCELEGVNTAHTPCSRARPTRAIRRHHIDSDESQRSHAARPIGREPKGVNDAYTLGLVHMHAITCRAHSDQRAGTMPTDPFDE